MSHRRRSAVLLSAVATALAAPAAATAGPLVADAPNCDAQSSAKVFLPWADPADYVLAPGGAAESASGWTLSGGAAITAGNEPWNVHGATDARSLTLPSGASATTATMCIGIEHPDVRFFASSTLGDGRVQVETIFETASGDVTSAPVGVATAGAWSPTTVMPIAAALLPLMPGSHTPVRFRFTSTGTAAVAIDDVYVDPYGRY
jgi:hypothetical protein